MSNSIGEFNEAGKACSEQETRELFETLKSEGNIAADSIHCGRRIFGYHDAQAVADEFSVVPWTLP